MSKESSLIDKILQAIKESGYSQREFARKFGIAENLISNWKRGFRMPSMASVRKVAKGSKKNLAWFFEGIKSIRNMAVNTGNNSIVGTNQKVGNDGKEIKLLKKENSLLKEENKFLREKIASLEEQIAVNKKPKDIK
ncbi:MAG: helix-turn-helix domain-containing protein [Endomicrobium sp.]|jgi:transcriptional regulator with XRE-family HTH domain|nr:helix-turn-helix domain-containing protein [Endomicrobium sp.]